MYTKADVGKKIVAASTSGANRLVLFEYTITRVSLDGTYVMAKHGNLEPIEFMARSTAYDKATLIELINNFKQDSVYLDTSVTSDSFTVDRAERTVDKYGDVHISTNYESRVFRDSVTPEYVWRSLYDDAEKLASHIIEHFKGVFTPDYKMNYTDKDVCPHCGSKNIEWDESCDDDLPHSYSEYFTCKDCNCPIVQHYKVSFDCKDIDRDSLDK